MSRAVKGLVLAAGLGTRLRPLTDLYPKPLVPFAGTTPLALAQARLLQIGIHEQAVNAHYKADLIATYVEQKHVDATVLLAREEELLGTGGVYNPLRSWLGDADLVVLNGDVVADFDLAGLLALHRALNAGASMALLPAVLPGESAVSYGDGQVLAIGRQGASGASKAGNFACAQVLSREFLDLMPKSGVFDVISRGYQVALAAGMPIGAFVHHGLWHDLRTPDFYWAALREVLTSANACAALGVSALRKTQGLSTEPDAQGVFLPNHASWLGRVQVGPCVMVEAGVQIGDGARISNSVLLPGAVVSPGEVIDGQLVGPALRSVLKPIQSIQPAL